MARSHSGETGVRAKGADGASSVEYGLLIAGIAALITVIVFALGTQVQGLFGTTCAKVATQTSTTCS